MIFKIFDIVGIVLSVFIFIEFISVANKYYERTGEYSEADITVYFLIVLSIWLFYSSAFKRERVNGQINQWSIERIFSWPVLAISYGISRLLQSSI